MLFAEVILPLPLRERFTYQIPEPLQEKVKPGMRVLVQFGKKKYYSALVTATTTSHSADFEIKPIDAVLDDEPVINQLNLDLWNWIEDYYMCPIGEVMNAAMPSAMKLEGSHGILEEKYHVKTQTILCINPEIAQPEKWEQVLTELSKSPKQKELLIQFAHITHLFDEDKIPRIERQVFLKTTGSSAGVLNQLILKKHLIARTEAVSRLETHNSLQTGMNLLNEWQELALSQIRSAFGKWATVLIHGVTASGKTEIYIHLMDEVCRAGRQVLYLIPEIALTPQIVARLKKVFGNKVGVYHSKMNDAERVEIWNKVLQFDPDQNKGYQVILGARSAIFLPFSNLGLIVVDEEHENSYKQHDPAPRYHARDTAVVLGHQHNAKVLLGSATPSFETYQNALTGKYGMVKLAKRHGAAKMPQVVVADIQYAFKRKLMKSMLTPELYKSIGETLESGHQVILFQNRRGYSPYIECMNCGWIPRCINCDVSMTLHKKHRRLSCHYCGHHISEPLQCTRCGSASLKTRGMGTEKVEDELSKLFPSARLARMDLDSTQSKKAFERIIHQMETRKIDILIGTQMVTKGLDIEHVGLVGVLNADNLLNFPEFRAHERAFQLIHQVSGRSGRKEVEGKVIIQTSQPLHPVIEYLKKDDYEGFFNHHIPERKAFFYPPWSRMIKITVKHKNPALLDSSSMELGRQLRANKSYRVLGPEYPLVGRVQQFHIKEFWLKIPRTQNLQEIKENILQTIGTFRKLPGNSALIIQIDVDPV